MLRKVLCLVLSVFCVVAFVGCGGEVRVFDKREKTGSDGQLLPHRRIYPSGGRKPCDGEYHDS